MYRGSRLAASFLLFLTGTAVTAFGLGVLPPAIGPAGAWILVPIVVAYGIAHVIALVGVARGRTWGRELAVSIAEAGGGIAIAGLFAMLLGTDPLSAGTGLLVWTVAMYALLGVSDGRIRFDDWRRSSHWWPAPLAGAGAA